MEEIAWVLREYGPDRQEFRATNPCNRRTVFVPLEKKCSLPVKNRFRCTVSMGFLWKKIRAFDGRITYKPSDWHRCEPVG